MTTRTLAAAILIAALGTALAQPPAPARPAPVPVALQKADPQSEKRDLPKLLATRVTIEKFEGKFKEAVKLLGEKYDLPIVIHPRLVDNENGEMAPVDDKLVRLPKLADVRLDTVLSALLDQVNGRFLVYPDHIKIVPNFFWLYESAVLQHDPIAAALGSDDTLFLTAEEMQKTKPLIKRGVVNLSVKNKPLTELIDDIAESTGANVTVSPLLPANVRQAPVTVRFANTPVDAAVRTLCEMTECGVIEDANVLLVTTRERAATRAKEEAQKAKDRRPQSQPILAGGGFGVPFQPDLAGEIAKLKDQNEQLKKELEEIKKLLKK